MLLLLIATVSVNAQMQLVLLKHEQVILRLNPGDEFIFRLKGSKRIKQSYVNNLSDTAVATHSEIIPFYKIDRVYFPQQRLYNRIGNGLVLGGIALFLIDQVNVTLVQGDKANLNGGVSKVSLAMIAAGLPMMLIKKKSQKLNHKFRLMMAKKGSPFYRPDLQSF
jgi:hypothetical protein